MVAPEWTKSEEVRFNLKVSPLNSRSWKESHGEASVASSEQELCAQAESETHDLRGGDAHQAGSPAHELYTAFQDPDLKWGFQGSM